MCRKAGIPLLLAPSIKADLDIDWSDPKQKATAIESVEHQVSSLQCWVERHLDDVCSERLRPQREAITEVRDQHPAIAACAVTPANRPEEEGAIPIAEDIRRQKLAPGRHACRSCLCHDRRDEAAPRSDRSGARSRGFELSGD